MLEKNWIVVVTHTTIPISGFDGQVDSQHESNGWMVTPVLGEAGDGNRDAVQCASLEPGAEPLKNKK